MRVNEPITNHEIEVPEGEPLVSRTIGLDDVNEAFELMEAQDGIRSVITYG